GESMSCLDHWHPILLSERLRDQPVGVRLHGIPIVLFRTAAGRVGALEDVCPHRRMRLSRGKVIGDRLQCPYHGWTYGCDRAGARPGTPKLYAQCTTFDVAECHRAVWVKPRGVEAEFPSFDVGGWYNVCALQHQADGPLEVVLDNFTEI